MSLQQKMRAFAQVQLGGIIPWESFQFPDTVNSDTTKCVIEGSKGTYRLSVTSSYAAPPLGRVVFMDGDHEITGSNQDQAWHDIAVYLKAKESGEVIKPIAPEPAPAPVVIPMTYNPLAVPPVAFVYYFAEPGAWYQNGPALVTRVNRDGSYQLTVFPEGSDPIHRSNVQRRSEKLQHVCWEEYPNPADHIAATPLDSPDLTAMIRDMKDEIEALRAQIAELAQRRGPGRPPNSAKVA